MKNVSVRMKISQFFRNYFELRSGRMFCAACSEFVSTKMATVETHIRTKSTIYIGLRRRVYDRTKDVTIRDALNAGAQRHKVGEKLPNDQRVFRLSVVETFLYAEVLLEKSNI